MENRLREKIAEARLNGADEIHDQVRKTLPNSIKRMVRLEKLI